MRHMKRDLTNEEFDVYLRKTLNNYLLQLECNPITSKELFSFYVEKLIDTWRDTFYQETNKRIGTVHHNEHDIVAEAITKRWMQDKNLVAYVNNRVQIRYNDLLPICKDIVDKFYIIPPYAAAYI